MDTLNVPDDVLSAAMLTVSAVPDLKGAFCPTCIIQLPAVALAKTNTPNARFGFGGENAAACELVKEALRQLLGAQWERLVKVEPAPGYVGAVRLSPAPRFAVGQLLGSVGGL